MRRGSLSWLVPGLAVMAGLLTFLAVQVAELKKEVDRLQHAAPPSPNVVEVLKGGQDVKFYYTFNQAIEQARPGSTVFLPPGTYVPADFHGPALTLPLNKGQVRYEK